jgi:hypothetical protein
MATKAKTKRAKNAASSGTAPDVAPVPSVTWEELVERAEAGLDENGITSLEKRRHVAEKKWRRLEERGLRMNSDCDKVKQALVAYYADCFEAARSLGIRRVFARCGARIADYTDGKDYWPELWLVMDYISRNRKERDRILAEEAGSLAQESQMRLVTEEGCELNQKAVEVSLKATMKDVYGDGEGGGASDAKKSVTYSFPNMKATWIIAQPGVAERIAAKPDPEVIDV